MTENEAIYCLKAESERYSEICNECSLYGEVGCDHCYEDATCIAIQALEEIQQVKEIISSFSLDCGSTVEDIREIYRQLIGFLQIGTIEEFQALKEKNEPRGLYGNEWNPVHVGDTVRGFCPVCMTEFVCITPRMYKANNYGYCRACGQKLDWH